MAWVSDAAKIADGGSGDFSSCAACSAATAASCGPRRIRPGSASMPAAARACLYPRSRSAEEVKPSPAGGLPRRLVADEADPPVPQRDEVAGRQPAAGLVVDDRLRHARVGRVHAGQCDAGPGELVELTAGQRQADGQHPVDPVRGQQGLQVPVPFGRAVHVVHDRVVALLLKDGQRAGHPDHGRRPGHVGDDERHRLRRCRGPGPPRRGSAGSRAARSSRAPSAAWTRVPVRCR